MRCSRRPPVSGSSWPSISISAADAGTQSKEGTRASIREQSPAVINSRPGSREKEPKQLVSADTTQGVVRISRLTWRCDPAVPPRKALRVTVGRTETTTTDAPRTRVRDRLQAKRELLADCKSTRMTEAVKEMPSHGKRRKMVVETEGDGGRREHGRGQGRGIRGTSLESRRRDSSQVSANTSSTRRSTWPTWTSPPRQDALPLRVE